MSRKLASFFLFPLGDGWEFRSLGVDSGFLPARAAGQLLIPGSPSEARFFVVPRVSPIESWGLVTRSIVVFSVAVSARKLLHRAGDLELFSRIFLSSRYLQWLWVPLMSR